MNVYYISAWGIVMYFSIVKVLTSPAEKIAILSSFFFFKDYI